MQMTADFSLETGRTEERGKYFPSPERKVLSTQNPLSSKKYTQERVKKH